MATKSRARTRTGTPTRRRPAAPREASPLATGAEAEKQLTGFLAKYLPEIARQARAVRKRLRALMPSAVEMIYDNYNALVLGFGPSQRPSEAVLSVVVLPRYVAVCFIQGARLHDPHRVLRGAGNQVRNVRLESPADLDRREIAALLDLAIDRAAPPFDPNRRPTTVVRSISAKQRPRRPA